MQRGHDLLHRSRVLGERLRGGRGLRLDAGGDGDDVRHGGDVAVAGGGDESGRQRVAAGRSRLADAGDCGGGDDDRGGNRDEKEASHALSTPLRGFLSQMDYRFVDCRWSLDDPAVGQHEYLAGHIPGAVYLDLGRDLSAPPGPGGRHPLPDAEAFAETMSRAGIGDETYVVAYGSTGGAERLWWLLRHFGHDTCAVIDLAAWRGSLTAGPEEADRAVFTARPRNDDSISRDELAQRLEELVVVDARLPARWRGEPNAVDKHPGRIPGALNAPWPEPLPELPAGELVAYCGSGVTACVVLHQLHLAGRDGRLYPGSWSDWEQHAELPVERQAAATD